MQISSAVWDAIVPKGLPESFQRVMDILQVLCHTYQPYAGVPDTSGHFNGTAYLTMNHSGKMEHTGSSWGHPEFISFSSVWSCRFGIRWYYLKMTGVLRAAWASLYITKWIISHISKKKKKEIIHAHINWLFVLHLLLHHLCDFFTIRHFSVHIQK